MTWFPGDFKWKSGPRFIVLSFFFFSLALTNVVFGSKFKILSEYISLLLCENPALDLCCAQSLWICIETDRPQESSTSQFCSVGFKENWVTKRVMNPGENACLMEWPICWMTPKQIESIVSTPLLKFFLTSSMEKVLYTIPSNTIRVFAPLCSHKVWNGFYQNSLFGFTWWQTCSR